MSIEFTSLSESMQAFNSKMKAAYFFISQIQQIYVPGKRLAKIPDALFYYVDATVFELHAASQMLLQMINAKANINRASNRVNWSPSFQKALKTSDENYLIGGKM